MDLVQFVSARNLECVDYCVILEAFSLYNEGRFYV